MSAAFALKTARAVGIRVRVDGDDLELEADAPPPPAMLDLLALHKADITRMIVVSDVPPSVNAQYDLSSREFLRDARDAFSTLLFGGHEVFSVRGPVGNSGMVIELVMSDRALRKAMLAYTREILLFTVIISFITASMIFFAINRTLIRPVARMTSSMQAFADEADRRYGD